MAPNAAIIAANPGAPAHGRQLIAPLRHRLHGCAGHKHGDGDVENASATGQDSPGFANAWQTGASFPRLKLESLLALDGAAPRPLVHPLRSMTSMP